VAGEHEQESKSGARADSKLTPCGSLPTEVTKS
jgi:hypothetical protein